MSAKQRKVPQRTCAICRTKTDKRQLMRFVRATDGVFPDPTGKANGRGAYVCDGPTCLEQAASNNKLAQALRVSLTEADRHRIRAAAP